MSTSSYLHRIGLDHGLPPTLDSLVQIHRAHLDHVPYENLATMLGRPPSVDPAACLDRVSTTGRAGYCFHQNAALEVVLVDLGFDVERRHGHVWTSESDRYAVGLNHLALVVAGLSTGDNPGGRWWPDVGLGEGFRDPLPLVAGTHLDGPFRFGLDEVTEEGWSFRNDASGTFAGLEVSSMATDPVAVLSAHVELTTPPAGAFARLLVVQRRLPSAVETVRGCVWSRVDEVGRHTRDLTAYDDWRGALESRQLSFEDLEEADLRELFERMRSAHQAWDATGRP